MTDIRGTECNGCGNVRGGPIFPIGWRRLYAWGRYPLDDATDGGQMARLHSIDVCSLDCLVPAFERAELAIPPSGQLP